MIHADISRPVIFVVGNSRSGTTMMMRLLDNHSQVHSINEPHFFEKMWTPRDAESTIDGKEAEELLERLIVGQRDGFFAPVPVHRHKYRDEVATLISQWESPITRLEVYRGFLLHETARANKRIPCEKTPQNVFYIREILDAFPEARVINMVRDPRSVMLSQKRKWNRKSLGAHFMTKAEIRRLRINYHPITISRLWNASLGAANEIKDSERVLHVRFEDLLNAPEAKVREVCQFANIPYQMAMLDVPQAGSSSKADQHDKKGIRKDRASSWTMSGLGPEEIYLCEKICASHMSAHGYEPSHPSPNRLRLAWLYLTLPVKLMLALLVNLGRMRSVADTIKRRWRAK